MKLDEIIDTSTLEKFNFQHFLSATINFLLALIIATLLLYLAKRLVNLFLKERAAHVLTNKFKIHSYSKSKTITNLIHNLLLYLIYFIYFYYILTILGIPIGTLLAGAGIFGIAIGLGAKDIITDIINGFFILLEGKFEIDDFVTLPKHNISGNVIKMNLRTTHIKSITGEIFFIPNGEISIVNNMSRSYREIQVEIPYTLDIEIEAFAVTIKNTTQAIYSKYANVFIKEPIIIGLIKGQNHYMTYRITLPVTNKAYYQMTSQFYYEYIHALQNAGIHLPSYSLQTMKEA